MDITRRQAVKLAGAAAALTVAPIEYAAAALNKQPNPDLLTMRERVQAIVDGFDPAPLLEGGQYRDLFDYQRAWVASCGNCNQRLEDGIEVRIGDSIGHVRHTDLSLGFAVGDDPDEARKLLPHVVKSFAQMREIDAAKIFNKATTYDPRVGADGVCLCSVNHPYGREGKVWSNTIGRQPLNAETLKRAVGLLDEFVDDDGLKIVARPRRLLTTVRGCIDAERLITTNLMPSNTPGYDVDAELRYAGIRFTEPYSIADFLEDSTYAEPAPWFILTSVPGFVWSERDPFSLRVEIDADAEKVVVVGHEKRGFGCVDPRAVIGAV